jgi:2-polyprenyl-3-methyl-5-hydroxy-6-metoxy-1,4-benzoquinol methylase
MKNIPSILGRIVSGLLSTMLPYRPTQRAKNEWERQYASSYWSRLKKLDELARYSVIVGYCHYFKLVPSILDVGCGEGVFLENFLPNKYARYIGIDLSQEAIRLASKSQDDKTFFVCSDATIWTTHEQFDIIIFNECLYYFSYPLSVVRMYERFLNKNGIMIVSTHVTDRNKKIWNLIERFYAIKDSTVVTTTSSSASWKIACWKPGGGSVDGQKREPEPVPEIRTAG